MFYIGLNCLCAPRLTQASDKVLNINASPRVEVHSDDFETRFSFWRRVFESGMPPTIHYPKSNTWEQDKPHKSKEDKNQSEEQEKQQRLKNEL